MQALVDGVKSKQREFNASANQLRDYFTELIDKNERTEQRFFELTQRIEELQKDIAVSQLVQQRDAELRKEAVDKYRKVKELFPNCEEYMYHLKLKPEKMQVINRERLENLCKRLKRRPPKESEIAMILDLDLALASITTEPLACLSIRLEHQELERQANDLRKDFQNQVNYLQAMLLESEQKYNLIIKPHTTD